MADLPAYRDLPAAPDGGRSAWGLFGESDDVGLVNLLTQENVVRAASLIRTGKVFSLNAPVDAFKPAIVSSRGLPRHHLIHTQGDFGFDDVYDNFYPQGSSQWDALGHVGYTANAFYNGATEDEITSGRRNTIEHWARRGIVGRAVVLDVVRAMEEAGVSYAPGGSTAFTVADLERARALAGVDYRPGDIIVLHTGFAGWFVTQPLSERQRINRDMTTPGIEQSEQMCEYLWDAHVTGIVSDTFAVERMPVERGRPLGFLHRILIGQFGMALGELWWTADLAADCAADGRYEAFLSSAPAHLVGGMGSPANALAIK